MDVKRSRLARTHVRERRLARGPARPARDLSRRAQDREDPGPPPRAENQARVPLTAPGVRRRIEVVNAADNIVGKVNDSRSLPHIDLISNTRSERTRAGPRSLPSSSRSSAGRKHAERETSPSLTDVSMEVRSTRISTVLTCPVNGPGALLQAAAWFVRVTGVPRMRKFGDEPSGISTSARMRSGRGGGRAACPNRGSSCAATAPVASTVSTSAMPTRVDEAGLCVSWPVMFGICGPTAHR